MYSPAGIVSGRRSIVFASSAWPVFASICASPTRKFTKIDKAVVLAAGRGTRMRELTVDFPKPMIEVRGKPVLQHIVEGLRDAGVRRFVIIVGYHAEAVQNFFGDGQRHGVDIEYVTQIVQDGTGRVANLARS